MFLILQSTSADCRDLYTLCVSYRPVVCEAEGVPKKRPEAFIIHPQSMFHAEICLHLRANSQL